uniref:Reverse transcriptase domain-containing protein n=1 Tax=Haemonchus contortus TaxID=6289 RepID=A0A7I4Z4H8_HAECO
MGVETADSTKTSSPLVGKRVACWTRMLECRVTALLDTGLMISTVPVRVLAPAKDRGFDVDRFELIKECKNAPVYDASNNRMEFLGAVRIMVELEGGRSSDVAFYIVNSCDDEVLLGTNALSDLEVDLTISQARSGIRRERGVETRTITVAKRIYTPPYTSKIVTARCDIEGQATGVVWPSRKRLGCGIFKRLEIPAVNNSDKPMILGQGEEIGRWVRRSGRRNGKTLTHV